MKHAQPSSGLTRAFIRSRIEGRRPDLDEYFIVVDDRDWLLCDLDTLRLVGGDYSAMRGRDSGLRHLVCVGAMMCNVTL